MPADLINLFITPYSIESFYEQGKHIALNTVNNKK